jgi:hypothetical protein
MHLFEKLWKAAYVFHAEGSLEAETFGSSTNPACSARSARSSRASVRALPGAACPVRKTLNGFAKLPLSQPHPNAVTRPGQRLADCQSRAPTRTGSKIEGNPPACAGPSNWLRPLSNFEPFTCHQILIPNGNSKSIRTHAAIPRRLDRCSKVATPKLKQYCSDGRQTNRAGRRRRP